MGILSNFKNLTFYSFWLVGVAILSPSAFLGLHKQATHHKHTYMYIFYCKFLLRSKKWAMREESGGILLNHTIAEHKRPLL